MNTVPQIQMFGDVPPRPKFRRFRKEENALKFAARMDMNGRLFKPAEPIVAHKYDGKLLFFVNYRNVR